jgi:hypothetical protein
MELLLRTRDAYAGESIWRPSMPGRCPLCGQALPEAISKVRLQTRLQGLTSPILAAEKKKLQAQYQAHLAIHQERANQIAEQRVAGKLRAAEERAKRTEKRQQQELEEARKDFSERVAREGRAARRVAEREVRQELIDGRKQARDTEARHQKEIRQLRTESRVVLKEEIDRAVHVAARKNDDRIKEIQTERERDKVRYQVRETRLQRQLDEMSRKLEGTAAEQLGDEAELDLLKVLQETFCPNDKVERIGRGVRGADILHHVIDDGKTVGHIVYESKNTGCWNKTFVTQAKKYQTLYNTPHVMIVTTRSFPPKQKGFCVDKGIAIIEKRAAAALARIIREGIIEIGRLRLSGRSQNAKSYELYEYIVGDRFRTRFRDISDCVSSLREQQKKERTWHENAWETETKFHEQIDARHREVEAQIRAIIRRGADGRLSMQSVTSEEWPNDLTKARAGNGRSISRSASAQ